jgi:DNA polymerase-3 subunit delta'
MVFDQIFGQPTAVATLKRALETGRLHHAYRFEGPEGVGKELTAFALAQALVCTAAPLVGCGACSACKRAVSLSEEPPEVPRHPDVVLLERGLYPPATLGRSTPESAGIGVEQVRRIVLARAEYPPHEARHLVFIIRAAHELLPSAGNALLKTMEEPRAGVHFVLLSSQPRRLSETLRSRTVPIRFGPLPQAVVEDILRSRGLPHTDAALAEGSAARALALADPEERARREQFIRGVSAALSAPDLGAAVEFAAGHAPDRASLGRDLGTLAQHFALEAARCAAQDRVRALRLARHYAETQASLTSLEQNTAPALTLESLIARLRSN